MFPLQLDLAIFGLFGLAFLLFVGIPVVAVGALLARRARLGTQLGLLRRRLGMSRPLGWAVGLLLVGGFLAPFAVGDPPTDGSGDLAFAAAGALYCGGVFVAGWALARREHLRLVQATPTTDTGAVLQRGERVELEGEARPAGESLTGPVTGEPALAYRYRVELRRWMSRRNAWVPVGHGRGAVAFEVDDGSGPTLVDPECARLDIREESVVTVGDDEEPPAPVAELTASIDAIDGDDRVRYREWRLPPGETAYVLGEAADRASADHLGQSAVADGDGPFVVADHPEEQLKRRLRWLVVYGGPGGAVAAVAGMASMLWLAGAL